MRWQLAGFVGWLLLTFSAAALGALASISAADFYAALVRPNWAPPGWLFGPVWSTLYLMMAISVWLVWRRHGIHKARLALSLYLLQLVANALWSWLFFVWHLGAFAFVETLLLCLLIAATILAFWRMQKFAALLLLPYLAWVTFAAALCFASWQLNPGIFT